MALDVNRKLMRFKRELCDLLEALSSGRLQSSYFLANFSLDECINEYLFLTERPM
jgi:hypothetical protein